MRRILCAVWLLGHFFFILSVSCHDLLSDLARGYTWLPRSLEKHWHALELLSGAPAGILLADSNPYRLFATTYMYDAGIENGYGFFAPNVPDSSKLIFELHYPDGHLEYDLPRVSDPATGLRLSTLLDFIGDTDYEPLRQLVLRMLAYSAWQEHPSAKRIRTIYGYVNQASLGEAIRGAKETYRVFYVCDFEFDVKN